MHCVSERAREYERQSLRQPRSAPQLRGARLCETALHESKPTHAPYASLPTASIRSSPCPRTTLAQCNNNATPAPALGRGLGERFAVRNAVAGGAVKVSRRGELASPLLQMDLPFPGETIIETLQIRQSNGSSPNK